MERRLQQIEEKLEFIMEHLGIEFEPEEEEQKGETLQEKFLKIAKQLYDNGQSIQLKQGENEEAIDVYFGQNVPKIIQENIASTLFPNTYIYRKDNNSNQLIIHGKVSIYWKFLDEIDICNLIKKFSNYVALVEYNAQKPILIFGAIEGKYENWDRVNGCEKRVRKFKLKTKSNKSNFSRK